MTTLAEPLRFGLVGPGGVASIHVDAIRATEGAKLVAFMGRDVAQVRAASGQWGVPGTTDLDELLDREDIDVIVLATPSGEHAEQAVAALGRGKHVLVEKPLAMSEEAVARVRDAESRSGRWVGVIAQHRFNPAVAALHAAIGAGRLGTVVLVGGRCILARSRDYYLSAPWRGTAHDDGGVLLNQAIHEVDLVCWFGGPVMSVVALTATVHHEIEVPDTASVSLRFASGALGHILATTAATSSERELFVHGSLGQARILDGRAVDWRIPGSVPPTDNGVVGHGPMPNPQAMALGHREQYEDFVGAIRAGRKPAVTAADAEPAIAVVSAAHRSGQERST